jgi:hypothetical protein
VGVVLLADAREQLEARAAVLVAVLHAHLCEHTWHRLGADAAVDRSNRAVATLRRPRVRIVLARTAREQTCARELLDADREPVVAFARLHRHDGGAQCGGAGGTCVGHVEHRNAGLADLLLQLLADPRGGVHEVARREHAHLAHRDASVRERGARRLRREIDGIAVGVLAELRHVDPQDPDVVTCHSGSPSSSIALESRSHVSGSKPKPIASVPASSDPSE